MPLLDHPQFYSLLSRLPGIFDGESSTVVESLRPASALRSDLRMHVGDWAEEFITLVSDARYFLAAAMRAWEIGPPHVTDDNGDMVYPQEFEEHRRFCWAALVMLLSALDKLAQLVNLKLHLGELENQVSAMWLEHRLDLLKTTHVDWHRSLCRLYSCEHVKRARRIRNYVVHRRNPLKQARARIVDGSTIEIEIGKDWVGPDELESLTRDLLTTVTTLWAEIMPLLHR